MRILVAASLALCSLLTAASAEAKAYSGYQAPSHIKNEIIAQAPVYEQYFKVAGAVSHLQGKPGATIRRYSVTTQYTIHGDTNMPQLVTIKGKMNMKNGKVTITKTSAEDMKFSAE